MTRAGAFHFRSYFFSSLGFLSSLGLSAAALSSLGFLSSLGLSAAALSSLGFLSLSAAAGGIMGGSSGASRLIVMVRVVAFHAPGTTLPSLSSSSSAIL